MQLASSTVRTMILMIAVEQDSTAICYLAACRVFHKDFL